MKPLQYLKYSSGRTRGCHSETLLVLMALGCIPNDAGDSHFLYTKPRAYKLSWVIPGMFHNNKTRYNLDVYRLHIGEWE
jgi:hypothetical protein